METSDANGPATPDREYDSQLAHSIWELERALEHGKDSESLRHALVDAHLDHLRQLEERAGVPREQRSFLVLQPRPAESLLLLPGEMAGAEDLQPAAEYFHQRGFAVFGTNLAYRTLDEPSRSPHYWQTCADEAENRFDILAHYATRIAVLGVGLGAPMALHLASVRRTSAVIALFPTLHVDEGWRQRLRASLRRLLHRPEAPTGWPHQRHLAAGKAQATATNVQVPLFIVAEDRRDRSEAARSTQAVQRLVHRAATQVRMLRPGESASVRDLSPALLEELLAFVRQH